MSSSSYYELTPEERARDEKIRNGLLREHRTAMQAFLRVFGDDADAVFNYLRAKDTSNYDIPEPSETR
jgi:hypothetical protein